MSINTHRICKYCNHSKPLIELHSTTFKGKIHYRPCCRNCWNKQRRLRKNKPLNNPRKSGFKVCKRCKIKKSIEEFGVHAPSKSILSHCKPCHQIRWQERWNSYDKKQRQKLRKTSSDNYYKSKSKEINQRNSLYRKEHPEQHCEIQARRRARQQNASLIEKIDRKFVIIRDNFTCYLCQSVLTKSQITLDHIIPLVRGGNHTHDNVKVCCRSCNSKKHTKLLSELDLTIFSTY